MRTWDLPEHCVLHCRHWQWVNRRRIECLLLKWTSKLHWWSASTETTETTTRVRKTKNRRGVNKMHLLHYYPEQCPPIDWTRTSARQSTLKHEEKRKKESRPICERVLSYQLVSRFPFTPSSTVNSSHIYIRSLSPSLSLPLSLRSSEYLVRGAPPTRSKLKLPGYYRQHYH